MNILNWAMSLGSQIVQWIIRPRNLGIALLGRCSVVLIAIAGGFTIKAQDIAGVVRAFEFSSGDGIPGNLMTIVVYLMCLSWIIGLAMVLGTQWREWAEADSRQILVIEMRGLVDTSDKPLITAIPKTMIGRRIDCIVDVRAYLATSNPNVKEALKEIEHIKRDVRKARGDRARADVQVVAGGVMQVPLLFYVGTLLDDEGSVFLFEWERTASQWRRLTDADDGSRFKITGLDLIQDKKEIVLVASVSYLAALDEVAADFLGLSIVHMAHPNPQPNSLWSEETQAALTQQFLQTLGVLANQGVKMVHLVLAAPATLAIRFGRAYDYRNMPKLRCYQREQGYLPAYLWSIQMPTATEPAIYLLTQPVVST